MFDEFSQYITYYGPCEWDKDGIVVRFNFNGLKVTVIDNAYTEFVELWVFPFGYENPIILKSVSERLVMEFLRWVVFQMGLLLTVEMEENEN